MYILKELSSSSSMMMFFMGVVVLRRGGGGDLLGQAFSRLPTAPTPRQPLPRARAIIAYPPRGEERGGAAIFLPHASASSHATRASLRTKRSPGSHSHARSGSQAAISTLVNGTPLKLIAAY